MLRVKAGSDVAEQSKMSPWTCERKRGERVPSGYLLKSPTSSDGSSLVSATSTKVFAALVTRLLGQ